MKKKKQEIIIDGVTWTLNKNNKYVNPDGKEVVKPRASNSKNSKKQIKINIEEQVYNELAHYVNTRSASHLEGILFFLTYVRRKSLELKGLIAKTEKRGQCTKRFYHTETGAERGVFIPYSKLYSLFNKSSLLMVQELEDLGLISIIEKKKSTITKTGVETNVRHYSYNCYGETKAFYLAKAITIKKIENFKCVQDNGIAIDKQLRDNTKLFVSEDALLNERIQDNENYKKDSFGTRSFSPITNQTKETRLSMKLEGEAVAEVDIKSCQPMMLFVLLSNIKYWNKTLGQNIKLNLNDSDMNDIRTLYKNSIKTDLYSHLVDLGVNFDVSDKVVEKSAKRALTGRDKAKFFWNHFAMGQSKECFEEMNKFYPGYTKLIKQVGSDFINDTSISDMEKKLPYKRVAYVMQRIEVYFVEKIKRMLDSKDIKYTTVHDSFLVKDSLAEEVRDIVISELEITKVDIKVRIDRQLVVEPINVGNILVKEETIPESFNDYLQEII